MRGDLQSALAALSSLFRGQRRPQHASETASLSPSLHVPAVPAGNNLVIASGQLSFVDMDKATADPLSWLDAFEAARVRRVPLSGGARRILNALAAHTRAEALVPSEMAQQRLLSALRPAPGLAAGLESLRQTGLLSVLLSGIASPQRGDSGGMTRGHATDAQALSAIQYLERLAAETSLAGERFGSLLRELRAPEILVLALLLQTERSASEGAGFEEAAEACARSAAERLGLTAGALEMMTFLLRSQLRMSAVAFRDDAGDPGVVSRFAALFNMPSVINRDPPEEHLRMLCLMTIAGLGARGSAGLTPWKAEVLWRLFVDTYNLITMSYGDETIEQGKAALASLRANRPHDILESEMDAFLAGLPQRYLTLFDTESINQHIRLAREIGSDDVHSLLRKTSDIWELTVVTLDKPGLLSNICGVLSHLGLDILRGQALTSRSGLVLDVFQFTDHTGCLARPQLDPLLSDVVAGRVDITSLLDASGPSLPRESAQAPVIYFDNESSPRYTILELVSDDAPGLLHRISRVISRHGLGIDLILISTESGKAFDVFHMRRDGAKLTDTEILQLTEGLDRTLR
jgi:[protein-PII] uridylyltransferase